MLSAATVVLFLAAHPLRLSMVDTDLAAGASATPELRLQVLLDRAHFSPGEIDGAAGANTRAALAAFQRSRGLADNGIPTPRTWEVLSNDAAPILVSYVITEEDVAGPFVSVPEDTMEKAKMPALGFSSALEALGERFHASPALLQRLNPGKRFEAAGEQIVVPNVSRPSLPAAGSVVVDESDRSVSVLDGDGKVIARHPATMGSRFDPLPIGRWKVTGVRRNPVFNYNPELFWDADPSHAKAKIAAGPNNPAGVVWIELFKEHYGIHGTPEPSAIGKTQSHGCIRLTNWDALELADAVRPGTPVNMQE